MVCDGFKKMYAGVNSIMIRCLGLIIPNLGTMDLKSFTLFLEIVNL